MRVIDVTLWEVSKINYQSGLVSTPLHFVESQCYGQDIALFPSVWLDFLFYFLAKLVPVGYGINKLQVMCVVEDEKVSIDELCEQIQEFEDFVQSVDIAAMSKI